MSRQIDVQLQNMIVNYRKEIDLQNVIDWVQADWVSTVVPALGGPCRERPPVVYGHVINVPIHFNVKLPVIGGHLLNADSHLLVVRTCYNGRCKQVQRFRRSFQPKLAGSHPNLRSTVRSIFSVLPFGDHKQYFISSVYACVMNHVISPSQRWRPLVTFVLRHDVVKVKSSVFNPGCRRRRFLVLTSEWRRSAGWMECIV